MLDELILQAREWLSDCGWNFDPATVSEQLVIVTVHSHFPGGWRAFARLNKQPFGGCLWIAMCERFGLDFSNRIFWRC